MQISLQNNRKYKEKKNGDIPSQEVKSFLSVHLSMESLQKNKEKEK